MPEDIGFGLTVDPDPSEDELKLDLAVDGLPRGVDCVTLIIAGVDRSNQP